MKVSADWARDYANKKISPYNKNNIITDKGLVILYDPLFKQYLLPGYRGKRVSKETAIAYGRKLDTLIK